MSGALEHEDDVVVDVAPSQGPRPWIVPGRRWTSRVCQRCHATFDGDHSEESRELRLGWEMLHSLCEAS